MRKRKKIYLLLIITIITSFLFNCTDSSDVTNIEDPENQFPRFVIDSLYIFVNGLDSIQFNYELVAVDNENDVLSFSCEIPSSERDWLTASFTDSSIILSGLPTKHNTELNHLFSVINGVSDFNLVNDLITLDITILDTNYTPVFSSAPIIFNLEDSEYSYTVSAYDYDDDLIEISVVEKPGWLSLETRFSERFTNSEAFSGLSNKPVNASLKGSETLTRSKDKKVRSNTTAVLSGIPLQEDVGQANFVKLKVVDSFDYVSYQEFNIDVINVNDTPYFTSIPDTVDIPKYVNYEYSITAFDEDSEELTFEIFMIPEWMEYNAEEKIISGIPENSQVGFSNAVRIGITDSVETVFQSFNILIADESAEFTSTPITAATKYVEYVYTVTATDIDNDTLTLSATTLPNWMSFEQVSKKSKNLKNGSRLTTVTGELRGIPNNTQVGNHSVVLSVFDGITSIEQTFSISIANANAEFTSTPITSAPKYIEYIYEVTATDIDNDTLSLSAPTLPSWMSFEQVSKRVKDLRNGSRLTTVTGELRGIANNTQVGSHDVVLVVSDGITSIEQDFSISVANTNAEFTSTPITSTPKYIEYIYEVTATDIDNDTLSLSVPTLPSWMTFNQVSKSIKNLKNGSKLTIIEGVIFGIPGLDEFGSHNIVFEVYDGISITEQNFDLEVINNIPIVTSIPDLETSKYEDYTYTVTATDGDGEELSFSASVLPDWLFFDVNTQILNGRPTIENVGSNNVTIMVFDGNESTNHSFVITVNDPVPILTSTAPDTFIEIGENYIYQITATDEDNDELLFEINSSPSWLSINSETGELLGTCTETIANTISIEINVSDTTTTILYNFEIYCMNELIALEGGIFQMGQTGIATPVHQVTLDGFSIGKYEITQYEWEFIMEDTPSYFSGDNNPVESISWYDVMVYCNKRSISKGITPCYTISGSTNPDNWGDIPTVNSSIWNDAICNWSANGYRLLTEAEWEFAARGGNSSNNYLYSGSNDIDEVCWYVYNASSTTHEVGTKFSNELGIYDMSGNVYEWNWDWDAEYSSESQINPTGGSTGYNRVLRGGCYGGYSEHARSANRADNSPTGKSSYMGFRITRSP